MAEAEPQATAVGEGSDGHAAGDMLTGPCSMDIDDKESSARGAQQGSEPEQNASRTEWVCVISRSCAGSFEDEHAGQEQEVGVADDVSYALDMLTDPEAVSVLKDLDVSMFVVGSEASVAFGALEQLAGSQIVRMWKLVKQAIHSVYESKEHRGSICRLSSTSLAMFFEFGNDIGPPRCVRLEIRTMMCTFLGKQVVMAIAVDR